MKCFLLLISVICIQGLAGESPNLKELSLKFDTTLDKCMKKHDVSIEQMKDLDKFLVPKEKNVQCVLGCIAKEMDIMKNDNTFDKTKITTTIKPLHDQLALTNQGEVSKKINEIIDICVPLQKSIGDECVAAKNAVECLIENAKKNGLIPK